MIRTSVRLRSRSATIWIRSKIPAMWAVDKAQELWKQAGAAGFVLHTCHSDPEDVVQDLGGSMPMWEPRLNKVLGVEEFVTRHAKATTGASWLMETDENRAMSVYLHFLANGAPIKVDISSAEAKAAMSGVRRWRAARWVSSTWRARIATAKLPITGFAVSGWASRRPIRPFPDLAHEPSRIWDIRQRFQWCQVNIRADELPPDAKEYGDLEFYLAVQNEGQKLNVPGIRH